LALILHDALAAGSTNELVDAPSRLSLEIVLVITGPRRPGQLLVGGGGGWKGSYHHQSARSPVGPRHGATAGGGRLGGRASDPGLSARPALSVTVSWCAGPVMVMTPR